MQDDKGIFAQYEGGDNVVHIAGSKKLLLERTHSENAFHTLATIRKKSKRNKHTSWLLLTLYLMAGLFIGAEIYLYLIKAG